jgi:hypothetical protein
MKVDKRLSDYILTSHGMNAKIDLAAGQVGIGDYYFDAVRFGSQEELIKMANFLNFVHATYGQGKIESNRLTDTDKPFSRSYRWEGETWHPSDRIQSGIEVNLKERANLLDATVISRPGLDWLSEKFENDSDTLQALIAYLNQLYQVGVFT